MKVDKIISMLDENLLSDIEELKNEEEMFLVKFLFEFDEDVLNAARSYSNEESDYEEESSEWYTEYFLPYLYEYGNDEVVDIIEEIVEELEISGEVMAFQMDPSNFEGLKFMALFTEEDSDISIEDVAKEFVC
jgi:6-pyruvoyl-tetrahydropterin synthase